MKNKKMLINLIMLIISSIALILIGICVLKGEKEEVVEEKGLTPLLYKVTKDGSDNVMYLFGSFHMASPDEKDWPDYIKDAYNDTHYLACEVDDSKMGDPVQAQEVAMIMIYNDETTLKDHLSEEVYNKLINFLTERGSYSNIYEMYKPMYFVSLLETITGIDAGLNPQAGVDSYFIAKAKHDNKEVLEVESMKFQINLLFGLSDEVASLLIEETIDNYDQSVEGLKKLYEAWRQGDEEKILEYDDESIDEDEEYSQEIIDEINEFNKKMVEDRNKTMTDTAINYFENNQDVFFMVGALHIIGEDGLANQLKEHGYTVTKVSPN